MKMLSEMGLEVAAARKAFAIALKSEDNAAEAVELVASQLQEAEESFIEAQEFMAACKRELVAAQLDAKVANEASGVARVRQGAAEEEYDTQEVWFLKTRKKIFEATRDEARRVLGVSDICADRVAAAAASALIL